MEFPNLGKHCTFSNCNQLDFLPFKCDFCSNIYCKDHIKYDKHECDSNKHRKDFQVPLCPLCNQAVPYKRNELPDLAMSAHIDRDCKSDPAEERRRQIFTNKCSYKSCKKKELVALVCSNCNKNYCVRHRHKDDHECSFNNNNNSNRNSQNVNAARLAFFEKNKNKIQNNSMSDDDALKLAIQMSLNEQQANSNTNNSNREDSKEANEAKDKSCIIQ